MNIKFHKKGSILILVLWTLAMLTVFAAAIGLRMRQRIALLGRLEARGQLQAVARSGIKKAVAALRRDVEREGAAATAYGKFFRHNNPEAFANLVIGEGAAEVSYPYYDGMSLHPQTRYGLVDEESRININTAGKDVLAALMSLLAVGDAQQIEDLAQAIIDWQELGQGKLEGFYSDEYYASLQFPYAEKDGDFEIIDELMLVKGVTPEIFSRLRPFVTIYGDGLVNINTASREALMAMGLEAGAADKVLLVRRGVDGVESTVDDYIFLRTFDVAVEMQNFIKLDPKEVAQIDALNEHGRIKTLSQFYSAESHGRLTRKDGALTILCVYSISDDKILYWRERQ